MNKATQRVAGIVMDRGKFDDFNNEDKTNDSCFRDFFDFYKEALATKKDDLTETDHKVFDLLFDYFTYNEPEMDGIENRTDEFKANFMVQHLQERKKEKTPIKSLQEISFDMRDKEITEAIDKITDDQVDLEKNRLLIVELNEKRAQSKKETDELNNKIDGLGYGLIHGNDETVTIDNVTFNIKRDGDEKNPGCAKFYCFISDPMVTPQRSFEVIREIGPGKVRGTMQEFIRHYILGGGRQAAIANRENSLDESKQTQFRNEAEVNGQRDRFEKHIAGIETYEKGRRDKTRRMEMRRESLDTAMRQARERSNDNV